MLRTSFVVALAGVTLLWAAAVALAEPPGRTGKAVPWMGVMVDGPLIEPGPAYDAQWSDIRGAGVADVRMAFYWPDVEPQRGQFDFSRTDALVAKAAANGLQVLPVVLRVPDWAAKQPGREGTPPKSGQLIAPLMTQLVARYGPRGTFWRENSQLRRLPIRDWQIFNEPDLPVFWNERNWAPGYVKLLAAANRALKRADRGSRTILAGLTNRSWEGLAKVYRAGGKRFFDAAALHIYTRDARGVATVTGFARDVMRRNGDRHKKVWLTEVTWPSSANQRPGARAWETSEAGQAKRVGEGIPYLAKVRTRLNVEKIVWYAWLTVEDRKTWQTYAGLRRLRDGAVVDAPAFSRFTSALNRLR